MARLQQVPEGTGKSGGVHWQARNQSRLSLGMAFATRKSLLRNSPVASFLGHSSRTILGSRRTGRRLGDKNAFDRPEGKVRVRVSNRDSVRKSLHWCCIRER